MPAKYDIFLSYSRADTERVAPLRDELRRRGYRVFFDTQSIDPGSQWKDRLESAIRNSRTLVLCWSEHTRASEYITFEYSHARALHKPIFPWLLDKTPLPALLEVQGITTADPLVVVDRLAPALGTKLSTRRTLQAAIAAIIVIAAAIGIWFKTRPLPPFQLYGSVTDFAHNPITGVGVDLATADGKAIASATSDSAGHYTFGIPEPHPPTVMLTFHHPGYQGDRLIVRTDHPVEEQLAKQ